MGDCANCPLVEVCEGRDSIRVCIDIHCKVTAKGIADKADFPALRCPQCGAAGTTREGSLGTRPRECGNCGTQFVVPSRYSEQIIPGYFLIG